jgi:UDP-N-acetylglucosamine 2-epimerase (non-hydrolysing)
MKILNVVGARPNFMKIAPLMAEYGGRQAVEAVLVHTGQHYDQAMSRLFFSELGIPQPDINLEVGSGSHAAQTAEIMRRFEPVVLDTKPDVVVVVGDVNSTIACGLVAVKSGIKLAHVEAGLRSFDRSMPEEVNRILTDAISDFLFCTEQSGIENLLNEGIPKDKVHFVGNVMIDTLLSNRAKAQASTILDRLGVNGSRYALLTLHRPANVDDPHIFGGILDAVDVILKDMPVIFPVHPRTRANLDGSAVGPRVGQMAGLRLTDPLGYLDFLRLMISAAVVLTDSGGIQEETTILKVPCLTLRDNTERPVTVTCGSNRIVGRDPQRILTAYRDTLSPNGRRFQTPPLWDGEAACRIVDVLIEKA